MASHKNCLPINESRFSKSIERIKSKNISFEILLKAQGSKILASRLFVRTFAPKIHVQIFAYLISKLLCSIYQNFDTHGEKSASLELSYCLDGKTYLESLLKVLTGKLSSSRSLWKVLLKRQSDRIILPLTLRNALQKSRRKVFAYLINC